MLSAGEALVEDAADRDAVRRHEGEKLEGDDGVEGDRGAEIDQREKHSNYASQDDGVLGNCFPMDLYLGKQMIGGTHRG